MNCVIAVSSLLACLLVLYMVAVACIQRFKMRIKRRDIELLHYTTEANANSIINTGRVRAGKDAHCYFFIKAKKAIKKRKLKYNKLDNADTVIVIKGVSSKQIRSYDFDTRFDVFRHKSDFIFTKENDVRIYSRIIFENSAYPRTHRK